MKWKKTVYQKMMNKLEYICDSWRHLICLPYSIENLHRMALELNIKKCWFHSCKHPHYDIPKKRIEEISSKCKIISAKELIKIMLNKIKYLINVFKKNISNKSKCKISKTNNLEGMPLFYIDLSKSPPILDPSFKPHKVPWN